MSFQIDQSGKIEQTSKPTVLALSNSKNLTIRISATEKQKLIKSITNLYTPHKTYIYQIFACLVFILLTDTKPTDVTIDIEYAGHNSNIKEVLLQLYQKSSLTPPNIHFGLVTKKSPAHEIGLKTFQNKLKPNIIVEARTIIKILTNKKGWRSRSSRENP